MGMVPPRLGIEHGSDDGMGEFISGYEDSKKPRAEENVLPTRFLVNEELLEVIFDEDIEGSPVAEVSESDLLMALKKRSGVEAQLPDLTEFMYLVHEETKTEPRGPRGLKVLNVKANILAHLITH